MIFQEGFSLIEIIVVIAIIGIIISFGTIMDLNSFRGDVFRKEQAVIVSVLERARSRAMANLFNVNHGVCYYTATDSYIIFRDGVCDGSATDENIPANINITENAATAFPTIIFNRLTGNTTSTTIHLTDGFKTADIIINNEGAINW